MGSCGVIDCFVCSKCTKKDEFRDGLKSYGKKEDLRYVVKNAV